MLLGSDSGFPRLLLYLLTMLVGAGKKEHIVALHSPESRERIGADYIIGVDDMRLSGCICYSGCDQTGLFVHNNLPFRNGHNEDITYLLYIILMICQVNRASGGSILSAIRKP